MSNAYILYIDDEPDNLLAFKAVFRRFYQIYTAQNVGEAMKILAEQEMDVIISDQRMPQTTGVEFFEQIKEKYPDSLRIILTGYSDLKAIIDAINKGKIYHYLAKPWKMDELKIVIDKALEIRTLQKQKTSLENEKQALILKNIQHEQAFLKSKYEALKNQINPHFLFNCLNTLTSLIGTNPIKAIEFSTQFSKVYRALLEHESEDLIPLKKELDFVEAYIFLQKLRFEYLQVEIQISEEKRYAQIVPFALQLVVENAIKHNIISEEQPLKIAITTADNSLIISNNYQPRGFVEASTGIGQKNLLARYELLDSELPTFTIEQNKYISKIPLI